MKELVICSYGLVPAHISVETILELRSCGVVFASALDNSSASFLKNYCRRIIFTGALPPERQAGIVMDSFKKNSKAAFMTYGHPAFLCAGAEALVRECKKRRIKVKILDAVSSLNAVLKILNLKFSIFPGALFVVTAWEMAERGAEPSLPTLVFDAAVLKQRKHADRLEIFLSALKTKYPPRHKIHFIESPSMGALDGGTETFYLGEVKRAFALANERTTLYIPRL